MHTVIPSGNSDIVGINCNRYLMNDATLRAEQSLAVAQSSHRDQPNRERFSDERDGTNPRLSYSVFIDIIRFRDEGRIFVSLPRVTV
jgi:hypothetical protein